MRIERAVGVRTTAFTDFGLPGKEWEWGFGLLRTRGRDPQGGRVGVYCALPAAFYEPSEALALPSLTLTRQGTIPGRFSESPTIFEDPTKWRHHPVSHLEATTLPSPFFLKGF